jgi:hypothetical protein
VGGGDSGGTLVADGTSVAPIRFTCTTQAPGSWNGIEFRTTATGVTYDSQGEISGGSFFRHCVVEYATGVVAHSLPGLDCSTIRACSGLGEPYDNYVLVLQGPTGTLARMSGSAIQDNSGAGLRSDQDLTLEGCLFRNNAGTAIVLAGTYLKLHAHNIVVDANVRGIVLGNATLNLSASRITNNSGVGLYLDSGTTANITGCTIASNAAANVDYRDERPLSLAGNWWGSTDEGLIAGTIRDCHTMPRYVGCVAISPVLTSSPTVDPPACAPGLRPRP